MAVEHNDHLIAKLSTLIACILAIILILIFSGCAPQAIHGPRNPFPKDADKYNRRPRGLIGVTGINQLRCVFDDEIENPVKIQRGSDSPIDFG